MPTASNLVGQIFSRLTVEEKTTDRGPGGSIIWKCRCVCDTVVFASTSSLRSGNTKSCGCLKLETFVQSNKKRAKHGASWNKEDRSIEPLYRIWLGMKDRCYNVENNRYGRYGALGITVCDEWVNDYPAFRDYMLRLPNCPSDIQNRKASRLSVSIDRIKSKQGYKPGNVRWATSKTQNNNRITNVFVKIKGERLTLAEAANKHAVVSYKTLCSRIYAGWPLKKAFFTPLR